MRLERGDILDSLKAYGESDGASLPIAVAALYLSFLDSPAIITGTYLDHLDRLGRDTIDASAHRHPAAALAHAVCDANGYSGDTLTYEDMQNADLVRVIDRRRGLPVALAILFIDAARRAGWQAEGVAVPGHFLLRLKLEEDQPIIDPFDNGSVLDVSGLRRLLQRTAGVDQPDVVEYLQVASDVDVLLRLLNNIKTRAVTARDLPRAAELAERMTLIAPGRDRVWLERGILAAETGRLAEAMRALDKAAELATSDLQRLQISHTRNRYRRRLN